jgi:putative transcriptional regulator
LNMHTFQSYVSNESLFIKSTHAGLTATIVGDRLRERREQSGLSMTSLSRKLGVSARSIAKYEKGLSEVTVQKAMKLLDIFGSRIFQRVSIFRASGKAEFRSSQLTDKYNTLGFEATETSKVPFDIIAKNSQEIILTSVGDSAPEQLDSVANLLDADRLVIYKRKRPKDVPALCKEEFLELKKADELVKLLKEF